MSKKPNTTHYGFNSRIVADAMTEHMPKIIDDMYYFVDSIMSGHGAKFVFHEDEPEYGFDSDQYLDKQMYYDAHLEVLSQLCGYLMAVLTTCARSLRSTLHLASSASQGLHQNVV